MSERIYVVRADWDAEAKVWVAYSDDIPGLATGADTLEDLVEKLKVVVPELLDENACCQSRPRATMSRSSCWPNGSGMPAGSPDGGRLHAAITGFSSLP
jgi:predicted RNase H-like HicB family nuclease